MKNKYFDFFVVILMFVIVGLILFFNREINSEGQKVDFELPTIKITLKETTLSEIVSNSKDIKYEGNTVVVAGNGEYDKYRNVEIKGRGNSTWSQLKNPFQIKFKEKVDLFGMGKAKKWILLANFFDKSDLRNDTAFYLEKMLEEKYALEGQFIRLYIDDEYQGIYYLTEKIEIDKERVDLYDPYGIIVEMDNLHSGQKQCYWTDKGDCLVVSDAVLDDNIEASMKNFLDAFNQLEDAAKIGNYERVKELADLESFVIYYLLSELTVNPDAYASSYYFYMDGEDDSIHVGPGWDFDFAIGNKIWMWGYDEEFYLPETVDAIKTYVLGGNVYDEITGEFIEISENEEHSKLMYSLLEMPEFQRMVLQIYQDRLMDKEDKIIEYIKRQATMIMVSKISNEGLSAGNEYWPEVKYLLDWVGRRLKCMSNVYSERLIVKSQEV